MVDLLIDTDVFLDHLRGARAFDARDHRVHYSVVTRAELLAGTTAEDAVRTLLGPFRGIGVGRAIAERAGRICREAGVRLPDALIAATALEERVTLVTRNRRNYGRNGGLDLRTP